MRAPATLIFIALAISQKGVLCDVRDDVKDELDLEFHEGYYSQSQITTESEYKKKVNRDECNEDKDKCKFNPALIFQSIRQKKEHRIKLKFRETAVDEMGNEIYQIVPVKKKDENKKVMLDEHGKHIWIQKQIFEKQDANRAEQRVLKAVRHDLGHIFNYLRNSKINDDGDPPCEKGEYPPIPYRGRRHPTMKGTEREHHAKKKCFPLPFLRDAFFLSAVHTDLDYLKNFFDNELLKRAAATAQNMVDYMIKNDKLFDDPVLDNRDEDHADDAEEANEALENEFDGTSNIQGEYTHNIEYNPAKYNDSHLMPIHAKHEDEVDHDHEDEEEDDHDHEDEQDHAHHDHGDGQHHDHNHDASHVVLEKLKDALACRLDYLWAHFLGLEFTGNDCSFCHDWNEIFDVEDGKRRPKKFKCPIRDTNDDYKAKIQEVDSHLLCRQPGRCSDIRHLYSNNEN